MAEVESGVLELACLIVDHKFIPISSVFPVEVSRNANVFKLKQKVKEMYPNKLRDVDAGDLTTWKLDNPEPSEGFDERAKTFLKTVRPVDDQGVPRSATDDSAEGPTARQLRSLRILGDKWEQDCVHVIIRLPALNQGTDLVLDDTLIELHTKYKDFFISVRVLGTFEEADISVNDIKQWPDEPVPGFVREYEEKLDHLVPLPAKNDMPARILAEQGPAPIKTAYYADHEAALDDTPTRTSTTGFREALHACVITDPMLEQGMARNRFREIETRTLFFELLPIPHTENDQAIYRRVGAEPWGFSLVIWRLHSSHRPVTLQEQLAQYSPKSDYVIMKSRYPRYLAEVQSAKDSTDWAVDHVRLLLQGAVLVRYANRFFNLFKEERNFVLPCTYFRDNGMATRYLLFQKKNQEEADNMVYYITTQFDLKETEQRLAYGRQLYNLIQMLKDEEKDTLEPFKAYKTTLNKAKRFLPSVTFKSGKSKSQGNSNKRRRVDDGGGGSGDGDDNEGDGAGVTESGDFRAYGYELEPTRGVIVLEKGGTIEPFYQLPPNIRTVHRGGKKLIAKKVRADSDEVAILKYLESTRPKSEHIISLLDSFHTQSGQWIILPKYETVMTYISRAPDRIRYNVSRICWHLIKGLAHLHKFFIAHRDIKPDNLVLDMNAGCCLKIIDFGLAMQMKEENEEVDDICGAETWMAPEVEKETSGPYSPIKADRWACGRVILYVFDELGENDNVLETIGRRLKEDDPQRRPSLLGLHEWASNEPRPVNKVVPQFRPPAVESAEAVNAKRFKGMAPQTTVISVQ